MPDIILTITIPAEKAAAASEAFLKIHPNTETIPDPSYTGPTDDPTQIPHIPKYTTKQWVQEHMRRSLVRDIVRGRVLLAREAEDTLIDDTIAT